MGALMKFMSDGGNFMYYIAFVLVVGIAMIIERFYFLQFRYNINGATFMAQIKKLVQANNIDRAVKVCNTASATHAALPQVIRAGLDNANKGELAISNAMEEAILEVVPKLDKRVEALPTVAQVATYLGLLGTIQGMILAFEAVGNAPPDQKSSLLAASISIAMYTTYFGLIVAVPVTACYGWLKAVNKKIKDEIELHSTELENLLVARRGGDQG